MALRNNDPTRCVDDINTKEVLKSVYTLCFKFGDNQTSLSGQMFSFDSYMINYLQEDEFTCMYGELSDLDM